MSTLALQSIGPLQNAKLLNALVLLTHFYPPPPDLINEVVVREEPT